MSELTTDDPRPTKSVITCDLEGRIETFGAGAESLFGYRADEVVGKKRVSLFSPGLVVLGHVPTWLKRAREEGEHLTQTVFLRKDGTPFAAEIRVTPTFKDSEQIGYCGVTRALPEVSLDTAMPPIGLGTRIFRWLVVTRAPFLTATVVPVLLGAAWVAATLAGRFAWGYFALALVGAIALHLSANLFNDYFDWKSGTDQANNDYFLPFSGGSRALELGLVSERGLFRLAVSALGVAVACGALFVAMGREGLVVFGLIGAFAAYFYTAPPLRLAARRGLGELTVGLCFGPLLTAGTVYALTGAVAAPDFLLGLPVGLLTAAILWINEFPDAPSDAATGKRHLVVVLGLRAARWGYLALLVGAFAVTLLAVAAGVFPAGALGIGAGLPLAVYAAAVLVRHYGDRRLVRANAATIQLQLVAGLAMAAGLLWF